MWIWIIALSVTAVAAACTIASRAKKTFKCPHCGHIFKPKPNNYLRLLLNFPSGGCALKCPECKNKNVMQEHT